MSALTENIREQIRERLKKMEGPVKLVHFTQEFECEMCTDTRQLLQEVAALSGKLSLEVYNFQMDKDKVARYRIDKIPATVVEGAKDYGIRLYGLPAGYEFAVLLEDILQVSMGSSGLTPDSVEKLRSVSEPVHLEVFVTPTCPYCPAAVRLAHQLAIESDWITADMVEATEYPDLVRRYAVRGVPKTVVNETIWLEGPLPESDYVERIVEGAAVAQQLPSVGP